MLIKLDKTETGIAWVTLNRPDVHNAFNDDLIAELTKCFKELNDDTSVRCVIIKGEGKSFSAGADLNWMKKAASYSEEENFADAMRLSDMLSTLYEMRCPTIMVTHGAAMGGGVGLLACTDIVIGVEGCRFALSEVKLGLTPATISPYVTQAIGSRWAKRLFVTGERFDTNTALKIGLCHEVMPSLDEAVGRAADLGAAIAQNAPQAVTEAKKLVLDFAGRDITDDVRTESAHRIAARRTSGEGREGLSAFLEKRTPNWQITLGNGGKALGNGGKE